MKTLRILIALCFILAFSANNAVSQKVIGTQTVDWEFAPYPGQFQVPCLTEVVSGTVTEYQSFTNKTYHVRARGVLYGVTTKEEYEIVYEYNSFGQGFQPNSFSKNGSSFFILPLILKHDGKLVAEIHFVGQHVFNGNGEFIQNHWIDHVNCK